MDVMTAIRTEPVVAEFLEQPVSDTIIRKVVEAGYKIQLPYPSPACHFIVVRDMDKLRALSECARYSGHIAEAAFIVVPIKEDINPFVEGQMIAYMQLAAWDFGLGSCLAPIRDPDRFRLLLHIPEKLTYDTAISFGLLAEPVRKRKAKDSNSLALEDLIRWEHW